jgi:demethylmenaquinone methyltransferase/2-methoxy-6-polyprenyl-1,4-benzoquinol methylase
MDGLDPTPEILVEQAEYYRSRAPEYDRWFRREGRYDRGQEATARWFAEVGEVEHALSRLPIDGADVLELASGTGIWTKRLAARAGRVTAIDASAEMIDEARARLGATAAWVDFVQADLFTWQPAARFDAVVFCFWISHVPASRLDEFLRHVASALRPGGSVFFLDGRPEPMSTACDHILPEPGDETMVRRLDDGRRFRIVKAFRGAALLASRCAEGGLAVDVHETETYFQYGVGVRV